MTVAKFYKHENRQLVLTHYDSVAELEAHISEPMANSQNAEKCRRIMTVTEGGVSWYGVATLRAALDAIKGGWSEGADQVDKFYSAVAPKLPRAIDFRRVRVRADQGDELDIHAVNRGAFSTAWTTAKRKARLGTGLIRIAIDICGNGNVSAQRLMWRGVAGLALSRALTKAGYSVEIIAGQSGSGAFADNHRDAIGTITVTVKPRHVAVDTATLAATACLPGFFRTMGFATIVKQADAIGAAVSWSLGSAVKLETALPVPEKITQVVVPESVNDSASAEAWIKSTVELLQGATLAKEGAR